MRRYWLALAMLVLGVIPSAFGADFSLTDRLRLQQGLTGQGFAVSGANGSFGPKTKAAISAFQKSLGHPVTGTLTSAEAQSLLATQPLEAGFEILENVDLPGNDYRMGIGRSADPSLNKIDLSQCQTRCAAEAQCAAFTYNVSARACFLKTDGSSTSSFTGAISGRRSSSMPQTAVEAQPAAAATIIPLFEVMENTDLPGHDIKVNGKLGVGTYSRMRCEEICEATKGCTAYTYNEKARICLPKSAASSPVAFKGATSGRVGSASVTSGGWDVDPRALYAWIKQALSGVSPDTAKRLDYETTGRDGYNPKRFSDYANVGERDYLIAKEIAYLLNKRFYDSNAGIGDAVFVVGWLYRYGMFDVADQLTAAVADSEVFMMGLWNTYHSPGSAAWVVANMSIGGHDYELAELALTHALDNTPQGSNDKFRLALLGMLLQTRDESGDYAGAQEVAREGEILVRSVGPQADPYLQKTFASYIKADDAGEQRGSGKIAKALAEFKSGLEASCDSKKLPPAIPDQLKGRDLDEVDALMSVAGRYVECSESIYGARVLTNLPLLFRESERAFGNDYLLVLVRLGKDDDLAALASRFVRETFVAPTLDAAAVEKLIATGEATNLTKPNRVNAARKAVVETRLQWLATMVRTLHDAGRATVARSLLDATLDGGDIGLMAQSSGGDEFRSLLAETFALDGPQRFLQLARFTPPLSGDHCMWPSECEIEILRARAEGRDADVVKQQNWLSVAYVVAWSGAGADATEMDSIKEQAVAEASTNARLGLFDVAEGYFRTAEVSADTIIADANPLAALDDIDAADAYVQTLIIKGDRDTANRVAAHIVAATKARAETGATFSDDSVMRWSARLAGIVRNYLATLPWTDTGELAGDKSLALFAIQFLQVTPTATTFGKLAARMQSSDSELFREQQDLGRTLHGAYSDLAASTGDINEQLARIRQLEAKRAELGAQLAKADPRYSSYARSQFTDAEALGATLKDSEAAWLGLSADDALYLGWIDKDGTELRRVAARRADVSRLIGKYRAAMVASDDPPALPLAAAYELYRDLLAPFAASRAKTQHIFFVPDAMLDAVPFAALPTAAPAGEEIAAADLMASPQPWLIRDQAITVLPSLASLQTLRSATLSSPPAKPFLGLGNPAYANDGKAALPPLPETEAEVRFLAALLGAGGDDLLLGADASEAALAKTQLADYRIIDFATHGFIAGSKGLSEPALAVAPSAAGDGFIEASEILDWRLNADLVLLSACNTAASDGTPGAEGLSGLANSLFYAGARNLMVTHWSIPSGPAVDLVSGLITAYQDAPDRGYAFALRAAVLDMLDHPKSVLYAHPVAWAGQFLVGAD